MFLQLITFPPTVHNNIDYFPLKITGTIQPGRRSPQPLLLLLRWCPQPNTKHLKNAVVYVCAERNRLLREASLAVTKLIWEDLHRHGTSKFPSWLLCKVQQSSFWHLWWVVYPSSMLGSCCSCAPLAEPATYNFYEAAKWHFARTLIFLLFPSLLKENFK